MLKLHGGAGPKKSQSCGLGIGAMEKRTCRDCKYWYKDWCQITGLRVAKEQSGCWWWERKE